MSDQLGVGLHIAEEAVKAANRLQQEFDLLENLKEWGLDSGINLTNYDAEIANSSQLKHTNGTQLNQLLAIALPNIMAYMESTSVGGKTYAQLLQATRGTNE